MAHKERSPEKAASALLAALDKAHDDRHIGRPVVRKKLRTLVADSGYAVLTSSLRARLVAAFTSAGLHVAPGIADPAVGQDAFLTISRHPIEPEAFVFAKEIHLERFVEASLGIGILKNLSLYAHPDGKSGRQFRVGGLFVDLLCREALTPTTWGLVAIELKRSDAPRGTLVQMGSYLQLLKKQFPGRAVRGIIVSSSEQAIDTRVLGEAQPVPFRIDWIRYRVTFEPVGSTATSSRVSDR